ncbi:fimbria subunit protein [Burkholderia lata]|uniref:Fimbria subunit protein n=1 Tax=Burkholderia lata (strain ATCC 17760 / DSM 23089 / LMG 22485 / NCIMB 9086 / R18194 / 383) TaxID=482957 RepID=A0A6P2ZIR7_BURL3|nr:fimbrial protein [Burkholderia lata]VWD34747.1 fimbria subunit protein [Burkholderia lata]
MKPFTKSIFIMLVSWAGLCSSASAALSTCSSGGSPNGTGRYLMIHPEMIIPPNAPDGSVISTATINLPYSCPANIEGGGGFRFVVSNQETIAFKETQFPGVIAYKNGTSDFVRSVGFRLTNLETGKVITGYIDNNYAEWGPPTSSAPSSGMIRIKSELIKLNDLVYNLPQQLTGSHQYAFAHIMAVNNGCTLPTGLCWPRDGAFKWVFDNKVTKAKIRPQTCTIPNTDIPVSLPPIPTSKLPTAGATAGDTGFDIGLSCKAGSNVYVTLTDLSDNGNTSNQLTLTQDSTAKGVKLRILRNGQPVGYGPDSAQLNNTNQWLVGPSASTTSIPLTAQYVATGAVSAGKVKGVATFTMSYQ